MQQHARAVSGIQPQHPKTRLSIAAEANGRRAAFAVSLGQTAGHWYVIQHTSVGYVCRGCDAHGCRLAVVCPQTAAAHSCRAGRLCERCLEALKKVLFLGRMLYGLKAVTVENVFNPHTSQSSDGSTLQRPPNIVEPRRTLVAPLIVK